jgi:hypothetical protein
VSLPAENPSPFAFLHGKHGVALLGGGLLCSLLLVQELCLGASWILFFKLASSKTGAATFVFKFALCFTFQIVYSLHQGQCAIHWVPLERVKHRMQEVITPEEFDLCGCGLQLQVPNLIVTYAVLTWRICLIIFTSISLFSENM